MKKALKRHLKKNGYLFLETEDKIIIKRKPFDSWSILLIFSIPGFFSLMVGLLSIASDNLNLTLSLIGLAIILFTAPFFKFIFANYKSFIADQKLKTISFDGKEGRTYNFSEIKEVSIGHETKSSDTNAFSEGNEVHSYIFSIISEKANENLLTLNFRKKPVNDEIKEIKTLLERSLSISQ